MQTLRPWFLPAALAAAAWFAVASFAPPAPRPADAPEAEFSARRAARHLDALAREPHPIGSAANARVRDYLVAELGALGFAAEVQRQAVSYRHPRREASLFGVAENVVAVKPGGGGGPALVLMSHYDSRWNAPGAADDGSGTAALLEIARALQSTPLQRDLVLVVTDGEEAGLLGAQAFVRHHPRAAEVGLVVNLDARGGTGRVLMFETSPGNGALVAGYAASVALPMANSLSYEVYRRMPNDTDLTVVKAAGMTALNLGTVGGLFDYHAPTDVAANLDLGTLQHFGDQGLALARHFGNGALPPPAAEDRVYFDAFGRAMIHYPRWLDLALTSAALAAFVALLLRARRAGRAAPAGIARGALGFLLSLGLAALLATALFRAFGGGGADDARYWWGIARLDLEALAHALLALGTGGLALHAWARWCRTRAWELALGALAVWAALLPVLAWLAPGAGFAFNLPLLAALAAHHWALGRDERAPATQAALVLGAAWGFALFALLTWLVHLTLGYANPGVPAVLPALVLGLCVPAVLHDAGWRAAAAPVAAALGGLALLGWHALTPPWDARHPQPTDLFLLADHDAGRTRFASLDGRRDDWQLAQVAEDAEAARADLVIPGWDRALWLGGDVDAIVAVPRVEVVHDVRDGGRRRLTLRYVPAPGELYGSLFFRSDAELAALGMAGETLAVPPAGDTGWRRTRWYALPADGVEVTLELAGDAPLELRALGVAKGFPAPHATLSAARPAATMPFHYGFGDSTVTVKSFRY